MSDFVIELLKTAATIPVAILILRLIFKKINYVPIQYANRVIYLICSNG